MATDGQFRCAISSGIVETVVSALVYECCFDYFHVPKLKGCYYASWSKEKFGGGEGPQMHKSLAKSPSSGMSCI